MDPELIAPLSPLNQLLSSPKTVHLGIFRETDADPAKLMTAGLRDYITIALTQLSPATGWFTFYEGTHRQGSDLDKKAAIAIELGDAIA